LPAGIPKAANMTATAGPAGKWKIYVQDAFGRLTKVLEPDASNVASLETNYTYDFLDRLLTVTMTRTGVTQTRTFSYCGLTNKLTRATNPENGTVQYEYDAAQRLFRKTDAKGQKVEYTYDSYNRVTEINRYPAQASVPDACQKTKLYWDVNPLVGDFSANTWGRVAAAEWGGLTCSGGSCSRRCTATRRPGCGRRSGCARPRTRAFLSGCARPIWTGPGRTTMKAGC
jgi:YD repeat-containing protein